jgi:asparagine synthase (glutamine-hydrolysing)
MCGIAGFLCRSVGGGSAPDSTNPLQTLAHRGPDDSGWVAHRPHPAQGPFHLLLLHRRLSILDLSEAGHQPMATADGAHTIVFNGEIYNYRELRGELARLGCVFHTQTDTEVLLQAYVTWGRACLRRLIGMFAFAVLDQRRRLLFLARDFFGIKPLYYVQPTLSPPSVAGAQTSLPLPSGTGVGGEGIFAFASEIKALLDWLPLKRTVQPQRLYEYLRFGRTDHSAQTLWSEIRQMPAAHYLEVPLDRPEQAEPVCYWSLPQEEPLDLSFEEAAQHVREKFLQNIRLHLRSDVPVGAALSGGIDSSSIVACMRLVAPQAELHAVSFIADDPAVSEEKWVDLVGGHARANVHKVRANSGRLLADLDNLIYTQDEPFGSTSIFAQYCVFRHAREQGIKVMLDGQGADEMLAGYHLFLPARLGSLVRQGRWIEACQFARRAMGLPGMRGHIRLWVQAGRLLLPSIGARLLGRFLMPAWLNAAWFQDRGVALAPTSNARQRDMMREELRQTVAATSLPMLLRYEDRNSMASSIESRLPFLTPDLAEFLFRLPEEYILGPDGRSKNVFRQAMRGIVPDAILDRRDKIGFATPEQRWLKTLRPWVEETLASERARGVAALNVPAMQRDWNAVLAGRARFDFRIWRWVNLIRWADRFDVDFGC